MLSTHRSRAQANVNNPVLEVLRKWCDERNRETYVVPRALSFVVAAAGCFLVERPWEGIFVTVMTALVLSFVWYPARRPHAVLAKGWGYEGWDYVPDRLLMLIAESPDIDAQTKSELADLAVRSQGLRWYQLTDVAARVRREEEDSARTQLTGFAALTSLVPAASPAPDEVD